jgi:S1-C subfamily serine protease
MSSDARTLSDSLARAVEVAAPSVVRIEQPHARPASGIAWSDELIVTSSRRIGDGDLAVGAVGAAGPGGTASDSQPATLVGRDPGTDIALLRVPGGGLQPLAFRDPGDLRVGELALALGRPGRSVRASLRLIGVLGEGEMRTPGGGRIDRYVETDRAIPRGFGGGPLVDVDGRGLGLSTRSVFRGADLAVPAPTLRRVVDAILAHGGVARGFLGVSAYPVRLPRHLAGQLGQERGALIVAVDEGAPAETAGLLVGDVLVSIAGEPVDGPHSLRDALLDRAGASAEVKLVRAGAPLTLTLTIGRRPS